MSEAAESHYIPVRVKGTLLFKYDPIRHLIQIKRKREIVLIDLTEVELKAAEAPGPMSRAEALAVIKRLAPAGKETV